MITGLDKEFNMPIFKTERLTLRPIKICDANDIFEYASDAQNTQFMLFNTAQSINETLDFINLTQEKYKQGKSFDYAFELNETKKVIGSGGAFNLANTHCVEIGYILNKKYWGKGIVVEAMKAITDYLFNEKKVHRIEAFHFKDNINSGKVMQKLGMQYEGTQKDKLFIRGQYITCCQYATINPKH